MAGNQLPLSTLVSVSVTSTPTGVNALNTSNVALFTGDTPGGGFGMLGYKIYLDAGDVATDFGTDSVTTLMALALFSQSPNILANNGYLVVIPFEPSETLAAAITRTSSLVQYFGILSAQLESQADTLAAAAVVQAMTAILLIAQTSSASIQTGGTIDLLRSGDFTQTRGLYYGGTTNAALAYSAAYAGRGFSVVFSASNSTLDMNGKQLGTIQPDPTMTPTLFAEAQAAGADVYASLQGFSCVVSSGTNDFFDNQYNLQWFVSAIQVAGFDYLVSAGNKIPQTEEGMDGLKAAYIDVCQQAVSNQYVAPGTWNSPTTFGNQVLFFTNISQFGYYVYSTPIAQQLESVRLTRAAPPVQIAIKLAGAINTSTVIIAVNP